MTQKDAGIVREEEQDHGSGVVLVELRSSSREEKGKLWAKWPTCGSTSLLWTYDGKFGVQRTFNVQLWPFTVIRLLNHVVECFNRRLVKHARVPPQRLQSPENDRNA